MKNAINILIEVQSNIIKNDPNFLKRSQEDKEQVIKQYQPIRDRLNKLIPKNQKALVPNLGKAVITAESWRNVFSICTII
ncbi:MAG: hypothetical protein ACTSQE_09145 [Candidatus Heimdallarchaeaceae archaeon]